MSVSTEKRRTTFDVFGGLCGYCMETPAVRLSHLVPPSRLKSDAYANLVPACDGCMGAKGSLTVAEWLAWERITRPGWFRRVRRLLTG